MKYTGTPDMPSRPAPRRVRVQVVEIDVDTGEMQVVSETLERRPAPGHNPPRRPEVDKAAWMTWIKLMEFAATKFSQLKVGIDLRVMFAILGSIERGNRIGKPQKDIAALLNLKPSQVCSSFNRLVDEGILIRGPKVAGRPSFHLSARYGWKGTDEARERAMARESANVVEASFTGQGECSVA